MFSTNWRQFWPLLKRLGVWPSSGLLVLLCDTSSTNVKTKKRCGLELQRGDLGASSSRETCLVPNRLPRPYLVLTDGSCCYCHMINIMPTPLWDVVPAGPALQEGWIQIRFLRRQVSEQGSFCRPPPLTITSPSAPHAPPEVAKSPPGPGPLQCAASARCSA